jgi:hypothetical protein
MLVKDNKQYIDSDSPSKVTKSGIRVISAMSTPRILWFVALRHRVGLLALSTMGLSGFIVYDKLVKLFI